MKEKTKGTASPKIGGYIGDTTMQMTRSQARDFIALHPETILMRDKSGTGYVCPICKGGTGNSGTGLHVQRDGTHFSCFSRGQCFKNKDIFDIVGLVYGFNDFSDKLSKAAELACIELVNDRYINPDIKTARPVATNTGVIESKPKEEKDYTQGFHYWHSLIDNTTYWKERGLTRETVSRFKIGYCPDFRVFKSEDGSGTWRALIIPITTHSFAIRNTDPNAEHRNRHRKIGPSTLYNPLKIDFSKLDRAVFIVEGEIDALSVIQCGGAAVALRSTDNTQKLIDKLRANEPPERRYIFGLLDSDEAGREAERQLVEGLEGTNFLFKGYDLKEMGDPNGYLMKDPEDMTRFIAAINNNYERICKQ